MTCNRCEELFGQLTEFNPEMESLVVYHACLRELKKHIQFTHEQLYLANERMDSIVSNSVR